MESKLKFNSKTGTFETRQVAVASVAAKPDVQPEQPRREIPAAPKTSKVLMTPVNYDTQLDLVDADGNKLANLDSLTPGILMFREEVDYDRIQIADERTGKVFVNIGGYGLKMEFNMGELRSVERIEQCLQGLTRVFRKYIMDQALNR